jgi:hypothetical protein
MTSTFLTYEMQCAQVTSFVHAIVKKVIPLAMFGSIENRAVILRGKILNIRISIILYLVLTKRTLNLNLANISFH